MHHISQLHAYLSLGSLPIFLINSSVLQNKRMMSEKIIFLFPYIPATLKCNYILLLLN